MLHHGIPGEHRKKARPSDKANELEVFKPKRASVAFNQDLRRFDEVFLKVGNPLGSNVDVNVNVNVTSNLSV